MRRGFTLIEIILTLIIGSVLAVGAYRGIAALYLKAQKSRLQSELSLSSQAAIDAIAVRLYNRVPLSVIGYDGAGGFVPLEIAEGERWKILEWIGTAEEALVARNYSGFVDMARCDRASGLLFSPDTDGDAVAATEGAKFATADNVYDTDRVALIFAGTFDEGEESDDLANAFGWHGGGAAVVYDIAGIDGEGNITLEGELPKWIYEKYYLADSAYAVARGADVDMGAACVTDLLGDITVEENASLLLLFWDYRPWLGETFCADLDDGARRAGKVTVLAERVSGFRAEMVNRTVRIGLDMTAPVRGSTPVHVSKQKVVF